MVLLFSLSHFVFFMPLSTFVLSLFFFLSRFWVSCSLVDAEVRQSDIGLP